jgi:hypothetical protein
MQELTSSKRSLIRTFGVCAAHLAIRSRKSNTENADERNEPSEITGGSEELRRLDTSSEPGPQSKRARTSEKVDIADKVGIDLYLADRVLSSFTSRRWTFLEGRSP